MLADGNMRADGALIQRPADASVDKESGTCSSASLVSGRASAQTARPATSIASLRCETVTGQAGHSSPEYFTNQFKKIVGKTPVEYREFTQYKEEPEQ